MSFKRIEVDPSGDTLIILQQRDARDQPSSTLESDSGGSDSLPEIHFLVSRKHLALASRRAQKMFAGGFKEAIPEETDGLHHWKFEPIFNSEAFGIVMKIIHGKTRDIPQTVTTEILAGISAVVDDLVCHDAVWFFARGWLNQLKNNIPTRMCQDLTRWILISFVFEEPGLFESSTRTAIEWNMHYMPTHGLPLRPKILDQIQKRRKDVLGKLIDGLYDLERRLLNQELGCSFGCRSMLLGTLIQGMKANALHSPRPSGQFFFLSVGSTIKGLRNIKWPKYYCAEQDSIRGKHSGVWTVQCYPISSTSKASHSQGLFGNQINLGEVSQRLVYHHCCIKDLVDGLLLLSEIGVQGLKLSDYS